MNNAMEYLSVVNMDICHMIDEKVFEKIRPGFI